jgi:hypothetical protein
MAVTDAAITTTTHGVFIPEVWADGVLEAVEFAAIIQKRVTREYEGEIRQLGDTVHIRRLSNLTTQVKNAGINNPINFEAVSESEQVITIATHEYAAFLIENVVQVQADVDLRARYERKIGYALSRGREVALAALIPGLSQVVGTYGVELTPDDYLAGWQKLAEAGLLETSPDPGEDFSIILSPAAYAAALRTELFVNRQYNSEGDAIARARVGDIYGFPVFISNLLNSPGPGQHACVMMHRGCFALAVQKEIGVRSQYLIRHLADGVVGWNLYGVAELNYPPETPGGGSPVDNRGVLLRTV